jgi:hypothetical protein
MYQAVVDDGYTLCKPCLYYSFADDVLSLLFLKPDGTSSYSNCEMPWEGKSLQCMDLDLEGGELLKTFEVAPLCQNCMSTDQVVTLRSKTLGDRVNSGQTIKLKVRKEAIGAAKNESQLGSGLLCGFSGTLGTQGKDPRYWTLESLSLVFLNKVSLLI